LVMCEHLLSPFVANLSGYTGCYATSGGML
jgi:hypothetical protein